jgi:transcriptional regulator with XRE-family HTH domain
MKPDATRLHNPDPEYIRQLFEATGLTQKVAAAAIGISERGLRYYLSGERVTPYHVQYTLEQLNSADE